MDVLYCYHAVVSVKVNTTDCDSVNMGSIPILLPRLCTIRLSVRTLPFHGSKRSSILLSCTNFGLFV